MLTAIKAKKHLANVIPIIILIIGIALAVLYMCNRQVVVKPKVTIDKFLKKELGSDANQLLAVKTVSEDGVQHYSITGATFTVTEKDSQYTMLDSALTPNFPGLIYNNYGYIDYAAIETYLQNKGINKVLHEG